MSVGTPTPVTEAPRTGKRSPHDGAEREMLEAYRTRLLLEIRGVERRLDELDSARN